MIEKIKQTLEFSELWWNSAAEGEPIAQDEIDLVKELNATVRYLIGEMELLTKELDYLRQMTGSVSMHSVDIGVELIKSKCQVEELQKALEQIANIRYDHNLYYDDEDAIKMNAIAVQALERSNTHDTN